MQARTMNNPSAPLTIGALAQRTGLKGTDDLLALNTVNDALGGSFLSRINMDLREKRGWSYGARGGFSQAEYATPYLVSAPVQHGLRARELPQLAPCRRAGRPASLSLWRSQES